MGRLGRLAGFFDMSCAKGTGLAMRIAIFFFGGAGASMVAFGCLLQNPPTAYGPAMFVAVGVLNIVAAMAGFWGSFHKKAVLMVFIILGGFSILLQIIFELTLFGMFDKLVNGFAPPSKTVPPDANVNALHERVYSDLKMYRWIELGFIFIEVVTFILAVLLKWFIKMDDDSRYAGFDEDEQARRMLQMNDLRSDVEGQNAKKSEKAYDKIREKMAAKYGAASAGEGWKAKTKMSWET